MTVAPPNFRYVLAWLDIKLPMRDNPTLKLYPPRKPEARFAGTLNSMSSRSP
jgi:hypothetical protein